MDLPITEERKKLTKILNEGKIVRRIKGVKLFQERDNEEDRRRGLQCTVYCFGKEMPRWVIVRDLLLTAKDHLEVKSPQPGDLAIYIDNSLLREQVHIGRIISPTHVRSKFGYGHVYDHEITKVPTEYGDEVLFFRPNCLT